MPTSGRWVVLGTNEHPDPPKGQGGQDAPMTFREAMAEAQWRADKTGHATGVRLWQDNHDGHDASDTNLAVHPTHPTGTTLPPCHPHIFPGGASPMT